MNISSKDIYLVDFDPSVGHEIQKTRPALVIGNDHLLSKGALFPIVPISTRKIKGHDYEVRVRKNKNNKLYKDSVVLANQIYTYDKKRFIKKVGNIDMMQYEEVMKYIKNYIGV